jgi:pseudouridine synthase
MEERLNKIISQAGISSRRKADELIKNGLVKVNNKVVKDLGTKVDITKDKITVQGFNLKLNFKPRKIYYALHKPLHVISSRKDEKGRKTVIDLIQSNQYLYPVGRLDYDSTGLVIITNDGELANELMHPSNKIYKTYIVTLDKDFVKDDLIKIKKGIKLSDGYTLPAKARLLNDSSNRLEVSIYEGRNRQIRRMFEALNYKVIKLKRVQIGKINLGDLPPGGYRNLNKEEISWLKSLIKKRKESKKNVN